MEKFARIINYRLLKGFLFSENYNKDFSDGKFLMNALLIHCVWGSLILMDVNFLIIGARVGQTQSILNL
jgi:hypothetical protein